MKSLLYLTCTQLPCIGTSQAKIILCIRDDVFLASGKHTLPGFLATSIQKGGDCSGQSYWEYTLAYDENLLSEPETPLVATDILSVFCESCFTDWIKELVAEMIADAEFS